jgi:beta-glucosidase
MNPTAMLNQMTLEEKAILLTGKRNWWMNGIPRLGIRDFLVADGPHGLRAYENMLEHGGHPKTRKPATAFPCASAMASTWNPGLIEDIGSVIGKECNHYSVDCILAPGVDGKRSPLGGRNFEYYSEDPVLTAAIGLAFVQGVQKQGVGTSLKHFALNEQETARRFNSSDIDERTFRELYALPFERIVKKAQPKTIMGAYNKVNGVYACQNHELITKLLREEWGFQGIVISDWGGVQDKRASIEAGLDIEMPESEWKDAFIQDVLDGKYDVSLIDQAVLRILSVYESFLANPNHGKQTDFEANHHVASRVAQEAIVLLKNDGILPLSKAKGIVVVGPSASAPRIGGGGSSELMPYRIESPLEAIRSKTPVEYFADYAMDADRVKAFNQTAAIVVFVGTTPEIESEGFDRKSMDLPEEQIDFLKNVAPWKQKVVVVNGSGSAVDLRIVETSSSGLVQTWFLGSACGEPLADVLFGDVNPSGRLSETFPLRIEHTSTYPQFPNKGAIASYTEGLFTGYRHFDTRKLPVMYPFGHGLSYTEFRWTDAFLELPEADLSKPAKVVLTVENVGSRKGMDVVQIYIKKVGSVLPQPEKTLQAFAKVDLLPGERRRVEIDLPKEAFASYFVHAKAFLVESGLHQILIASDVQTVRFVFDANLIGSPEAKEPLTLSHPIRFWTQQSDAWAMLVEVLGSFRKLGWWEYEEPALRIVKRVLNEAKASEEAVQNAVSALLEWTREK